MQYEAENGPIHGAHQLPHSSTLERIEGAVSSRVGHMAGNILAAEDWAARKMHLGLWQSGTESSGSGVSEGGSGRDSNALGSRSPRAAHRAAGYSNKGYRSGEGDALGRSGGLRGESGGGNKGGVKRNVLPDRVAAKRKLSDGISRLVNPPQCIKVIVADRIELLNTRK